MSADGTGLTLAVLPHCLNQRTFVQLLLLPSLTHNRHSFSRARVIRRTLEEGGSVRELRPALVLGNAPPQIGTPRHLPRNIVDRGPGSRGAIPLVALTLRRWPSWQCGDQTFLIALDRISLNEPISFAACLLAELRLRRRHMVTMNELGL